MSRSLHPPCAGSAVYGPHSAKVPAAYTVISPGGHVWYACDTDCVRRHLDELEAEARSAAEWQADHASGRRFPLPSPRSPA